MTLHLTRRLALVVDTEGVSIARDNGHHIDTWSWWFPTRQHHPHWWGTTTNTRRRLP